MKRESVSVDSRCINIEIMPSKILESPSSIDKTKEVEPPKETPRFVPVVKKVKKKELIPVRL